MPSVNVQFVESDWLLMPEVDSLLYEVLYRDFGVAPHEAWRCSGAQDSLAVAMSDEGEVMGSIRLVSGDGEEPRQLRQLAVKPAARGYGLGRALVVTIEDIAAWAGVSALWLNARDTAYDFYEHLGYRFDGDTFVSELTGIPHRRMVKEISGWRCSSCRRSKGAIWVPKADVPELG